MTSGGRETLKWLAVLLMTGDHVARVLFGGYLPVVSELGRIAFPIFALVMAYNLSEPGADLGKSVRRLALCAAIAQPGHALAFGQWLPLNVLASFALAAGVVWAIREGRWWAVALLAGPVALLVDYQWSGLAMVASGCAVRRLGWTPSSVSALVLAFCLLCLYNGNGWALLALPVMALGYVPTRVPRTRWAFYGYYVGHLAALALLVQRMDTHSLLQAAGLIVAGGILAFAARGLWIAYTVKRDLRRYDAGHRR